MEIKFRGFSIENNCWIYGFYHEVEVEGIKHSYIFWQGDSFPVDILSVGMFTGMRDKNNVEIYNGDICKAIGMFGNRVISFIKGIFVIISDDGYIPLNWNSIKEIPVIIEEDANKWLEVIGNTYETHPDLIK